MHGMAREVECEDKAIHMRFHGLMQPCIRMRKVAPHAKAGSLDAIVDRIEAALVVDMEGVIVVQAINCLCTARNSKYEQVAHYR